MCKDISALNLGEKAFESLLTRARIAIRERVAANAATRRRPWRVKR